MQCNIDFFTASPGLIPRDLLEVVQMIGFTRIAKEVVTPSKKVLPSAQGQGRPALEGMYPGLIQGPDKQTGRK